MVLAGRRWLAPVFLPSAGITVCRYTRLPFSGFIHVAVWTDSTFFND